jgi:hypothetical protein
MALLNFYRLYTSLCAGAAIYMLWGRNFWLALGCAALFRLSWFFIESFVNRILVDLYYKRHIYEFKQQLGPYGIRLANRAEDDRAVRKSLSEVFVPSIKKLQKNYEYLKVLDSLYGAGMRPDQETSNLNDCKLKYAAFRLEHERSGTDK